MIGMRTVIDNPQGDFDYIFNTYHCLWLRLHCLVYCVPFCSVCIILSSELTGTWEREPAALKWNSTRSRLAAFSDFLFRLSLFCVLISVCNASISWSSPSSLAASLSFVTYLFMSHSHHVIPFYCFYALLFFFAFVLLCTQSNNKAK